MDSSDHLSRGAKKPRIRRYILKHIPLVLLCCTCAATFMQLRRQRSMDEFRNIDEMKTIPIRRTHWSIDFPPASFCLNDTSAIRPFLSQEESRAIVAKYFRNVTHANRKNVGNRKDGSRKADVTLALLHLLKEATKLDKMLLTLQLGGHNGRDNDPIYSSFVLKNKKKLSLDHWMPIIVEPVESNFAKLTNTYQEHKDLRGLKCSYLAQRAVAYGNDVDTETGQKTCTFFRFNDSPTAPKRCQNQPDWIKSQIGQLTPDTLKAVFGEQLYKRCVVPDKIPCGSVADLFVSAGLVGALEKVAMIQIDIEGYEAVLLPAFLKESQEKNFGLPPILNYESKTVVWNDKRDQTDRLSGIHAMLRANGFEIYSNGHDDLAVYNATIAALKKTDNIILKGS